MSCGQTDTKQKELELKERELALKEKELSLKYSDSNHSPSITLLKIKQTGSATNTEKSLIITPLTVSGDIGQVTFTQKDKTVFYYDAKSKKGEIKFNGIEYVLKLQYLNGGYKLTGDKVTITATNGNFEEMESEP